MRVYSTRCIYPVGQENRVNWIINGIVNRIYVLYRDRCRRHITGCVFNAVPRPMPNHDCRRVRFARAIGSVSVHSTVASESRVAIEYKYFVVKQRKQVWCRQIIPFKPLVYCRGSVVTALFPSPSVLRDWESDMLT